MKRTHKFKRGALYQLLLLSTGGDIRRKYPRERDLRPEHVSQDLMDAAEAKRARRRARILAKDAWLR